MSIDYFIILGHLVVYRTNKCKRSKSQREAVDEVPAGPWEENPAESDTEEEGILEARDQVPLRIRISGARGRGGPLAADVPAVID